MNPLRLAYRLRYVTKRLLARVTTVSEICRDCGAWVGVCVDCSGMLASVREMAELQATGRPYIKPPARFIEEAHAVILAIEQQAVPTTVYAICAEGVGAVELYTTRELAEAALGEGLRREYNRLVAMAGKVIPRQGYKDGHGGIIPQRHEHPGDFDEWCRRHGEAWIEELALHDALPEQPPLRPHKGADKGARMSRDGAAERRSG